MIECLESSAVTQNKINRNGCRSNRTMAMQDWQLSMA